MSKIKIRIVGGSVFIRIPYKHGTVVWEWNTVDNVWSLRRHGFYSPNKVKKFHAEYIMGTGLYSEIRRFAAASHCYEILNNLRALRGNL